MATSPLTKLRSLADPVAAAFLQKYFKTEPGGYGDGDVFLGIKLPLLHKIAREFESLSLADVESLLQHKLHEARTLSLMILVRQFAKADAPKRSKIIKLYFRNLKFINNWDLVDTSAGPIVGAYYFERDDAILDKLARSKVWHERRVAIIATQYHISKRSFDRTLDLAEKLLDDEHDLLHKAAGWMLREVGKRDESVLRTFLDKHVARMPRTMLRYAIERLPENDRQAYLKTPRSRRTS